MRKTILFLYEGPDEPRIMAEIAAALERQGDAASRINLSRGDYDDVLAAVALTDTTVFWPASD